MEAPIPRTPVGISRDLTSCKAQFLRFAGIQRCPLPNMGVLLLSRLHPRTKLLMLGLVLPCNSK